MKKILMIDPEEGWKYGFPKPAPKDFHEWEDSEGLNRWLWDNGYPEGKVPRYCRYFEISDEEMSKPGDKDYDF